LLQIFRGAAATDVELQIQKWFQPRANILLTLSPGIADELGFFSQRLRIEVLFFQWRVPDQYSVITFPWN
jgi:hypothetical protein